MSHGVPSRSGGTSLCLVTAPEKTKVVLDESKIPTHWYNIVADLPEPPPPPLHPATMLEVRRAVRACDLSALRAATPALFRARDRAGIEAWLKAHGAH